MSEKTMPIHALSKIDEIEYQCCGTYEEVLIFRRFIVETYHYFHRINASVPLLLPGFYFEQLYGRCHLDSSDEELPPVVQIYIERSLDEFKTIFGENYLDAIPEVMNQFFSNKPELLEQDILRAHQDMKLTTHSFSYDDVSWFETLAGRGELFLRDFRHIEEEVARIHPSRGGGFRAVK